MANWWESADSWRELEEADEGFTAWAHAYKREHGFFPGGGQDESLAQAISNREWSRGVQAERGSGPTQQEWVSHYYRPDELGDTGQYWPAAVGIINKAFPEAGAKTSNKPGFNDVAAQIQYDLMAPYWEQMAKFGVGKAGGTTGGTGTEWEDILRQEAEAQGVAEYYPILRAIVDQESGGDPTAVNAQTMATGLMQIMPSDVSDRYDGMFDDRPTSAELLDPAVNIREGVADFVRKLNAADGDVVTALTNYSGGYDTSKYAAPVIERAQRYGGGQAAPLPTYNEPNPDNAYMMREDAGVPVPEPEPPETFKPGPEAYEALTNAGLYKPTAEAQAALAATGAKPDTRRQVTSQDPTQQTLGAIINALISAYPQAAGTAIDRWNQGIDARDRGFARVRDAIEKLPPSPVDLNAPMGEPGNLEQMYREAVTDWATPKKPGPVSSTDALNMMRQTPDTQERPAPGVVWERLYLNPDATEAQRQTALRNLGLRNESDFQLYMMGQNRPEVQAAKQLALDMWERGESDVDLPTQNLFVTPEGAAGATKVLSAVAAIVPEMVIRPSAFAVAEIGKAITSSVANTPKIGEWVQDLAASAAGALPQVTMPTLGGVGRAAVTALAQGGYLPEQILGFLSVAQMNREQLQRWSNLEAGRQAVLDLRAAGMEDTPEYRQALYRLQQMEAQEKARYEAALGVDVSGVPGIQQLETFVGGFYSPEELANATTAPPTLEQARRVVVDPAKRAAAWEAARAGYWTSPGLVALTYQQLLGLPMDDWEEAIQKAATYQNLGNEMLGQIPFDLYNLRLFEAPGRAIYNRFMNRGKNYWIADVSKTADDALDDIVRANQKRGLIPTILPGATVDARRAETLNKLSVSMQMATSGAETADDYVRLLAGYTADPVGFLNKRGLPQSQGMLEGAAILREYAGFGVKDIRVQRYADDLAEAVQHYKTAKVAGEATDELVENVKQLRRRLNTAQKADPAESLAKRLDRVADEGKRIHGYAGADLREFVQEEAFAKLQKTIDGLIPESSANLLEKGLSPVMKSPYYRGFMNVLVTGHMGLNPGWFFRNMTTDGMIMMVDGYNPFRSKKAVRKFIDDLGIEPRSVSKAAPIGRQAGAGGTDIGMMKPQSELERYNGEKIFTESAGNTIRPLNLQGVDSVFLKNAPKGTFTPNQEAYIRRIGEQALSERKFRNDFGRLFDGTATVDDVLGPPTWKQAYGLNVEDEVKKLVEAQDDAARAAIRKAQDETLDKYVEKHPLTDHPRVDSEEAARVAQRQRVAPDTVDPAEMPAGQADAIDRRLAEMAADDLDETIDVSKQEMIWRSRVHAPRFAPYTESKGKVLAAIRSFTDEEGLAKAAGAHEVWGEMVVAQKAAKERFAHAAELFEEANEAFALAGKRTGKVKGLFSHADNAWAKAARQSTEELSEAYNKFTDFYNGATGKKWVGPVAPKGPAPSTSPAAKAVPAPKVEAPAVETPPQVARAEEAATGAATPTPKAAPAPKVEAPEAPSGPSSWVVDDTPKSPGVGAHKLLPDELKNLGFTDPLETNIYRLPSNSPILKGWKEVKPNRKMRAKYVKRDVTYNAIPIHKVETPPQVARAEEAAGAVPEAAADWDKRWGDFGEAHESAMPNRTKRVAEDIQNARDTAAAEGRVVQMGINNGGTEEQIMEYLSKQSMFKVKSVREEARAIVREMLAAKNAPSIPAPKGVAGAVADETATTGLNVPPGTEKSAGHIGFGPQLHSTKPFEYYEIDGDIYRAPIDNPVMTDGHRAGRNQGPAHMLDSIVASNEIGVSQEALARYPDLAQRVEAYRAKLAASSAAPAFAPQPEAPKAAPQPVDMGPAAPVQQKYYVPLESGEGKRWVEVPGKPYKSTALPEADLFIHRPYDGSKGFWYVSDGKTGVRIGEGKTQAQAIERAERALTERGITPESFAKAQRDVAQKYGSVSPRYGGTTPPAGGVAGKLADETGSLDLTSIKGQAEHTKRFLDDVAERLKGRPGLSKVEPLSDAAKKHLRENYKEWVRVLNKNRLVAANYGEHARHFAMHNYDGKMSADQLASLTLMYPFWSTRTYAKLPLRAMMHPGLMAKYLRYKRWLAEENKDLPEWYRSKIVIDNTKIPWLPEEMIIDLEASLNPYNTLNREPFDRPRQTEGGDVSSTLGKYMQFVEKYGFNAHFGIIAAYAASKALEGDPEAAKAGMGYPAPALRALRDITAWMGLNNGWGIELVPWHWRQGLQTPFTGGDYYTLRRIAAQIGKLTMSGQISPLDGREAAIAYARGETDNPIIRKALEAESEQRGAYNILGFFTSFSAKGRTGYDKELDQFYADMDQLYASAANMADDEFKQALSEFYNDPAHYHYRVADIARSDVDEAETKYIRDIWWNSIPPGQTDVAIAKYGDEQLERIIDVALRGDGIGALTEEERIRLNMFMAGLSAKYPPPNQEMFEEWRAATAAWEAMETAAEEKFGDGTAAISAADAVRMMRQGQGQPPQSEFDRIMEAYWEADPETRQAMRKQYPVIDEYYDWRTNYLENDPLLAWYYADPPREQAANNLWNLYNAYTDSGMAQTKVDLAEDLDAMGADMGIPGCALDEEGEGCFSRYFRNQDTRDYEKIPNELLLAWTLYVASESAKRGVDPNVYRTQEGEAPGTQVLAPEPSGGDPAVVTSPWQMGESEPARTGLPGTEYERTYGAGAPGLEVPPDVPGRATTTLPPDEPGLAAPGVDVAPATPGQSPGGSDGKPMATGDGGAELGTPSASTGEKSFWDFDFTEEQFERAAPEMDALRSERNRLYKLCDEGVEEACNQLKEDRFNVFSTPEWLFYYEQIAPGWRTQDSGFYDDPLIKQWLDPTTREGVTAESALKRMQELKNALPGISFGDPKEYSQARDEQEQWKELSANLMPGTMAYRQAQASFADEHPVWAKYYLRPQTAASLAEYAARGWTYAPGGGGGRSSSGGGTSGGSGYRYTGPWFSPDTYRGANTSRRPAVQDSDLWQRVVMAALSRTKQ